ncbi:hypothetical protein AB0M12_15935 [Nocardia vinacea]|uniref:hypothetical protein n=1 Tax=Nocardia vinacea TaxID=96468 RepID=UPI00343B7843
MVVFAYLGALLARTTEITESWIPLVLTLYGIGALIGITIGGRAADAHPLCVLTVGMIGLIIISAGLALTVTLPASVVIADSAPDVR